MQRARRTPLIVVYKIEGRIAVVVTQGSRRYAWVTNYHGTDWLFVEPDEIATAGQVVEGSARALIPDVPPRPPLLDSFLALEAVEHLLIVLESGEIQRFRREAARYFEL